MDKPWFLIVEGLMGLGLLVGLLWIGGLWRWRRRRNAQVENLTEAMTTRRRWPGREAEAPVVEALPDEPEPEIETEIAPEIEPEPEGEGVAEAPPEIVAARGRAIVFARQLPPLGAEWLSYHGGVPTAPDGFAWPHSAQAPERPLHFLMQLDCAALAKVDPTGLLPGDGVLYCFVDHVSGTPFDARVLHQPGAAAGWAPVTPPAGLGPVSRAAALPWCTNRTVLGGQGLPVTWPRWTFAPVAIDCPADEDEPFWSGSPGEALLAAQAATIGAAEYDPERGTAPMARPFAAFPHDWAAVRVIAVRALDNLDRAGTRLARVLPELEAEEREARFAEWREQAAELFDFAARHDLRGVVDPGLADDIWGWCESVAPVLGLGFSGLVEEAVNASLGLGSEGVAAIPGEWVRRIAVRHALAYEWERDAYPHEAVAGDGETLVRVRDVHAPAPNRMFGPPGYVQGDCEELVADHVLLLEMRSSDEIGFQLGDGVIQLFITPDDLRERRFDRVKVIATGY